MIKQKEVNIEAMILDALFAGRIYPAETVVPDSKAFRDGMKETEKLMEYFEKILSKEDYERLEKLNDCILEGQRIMGKEMFKAGFVMGSLLMKEVYEYPIQPSMD